jgi:hypothetical protein
MKIKSITRQTPAMLITAIFFASCQKVLIQIQFGGETKY